MKEVTNQDYMDLIAKMLSVMADAFDEKLIDLKDVCSFFGRLEESFILYTLTNCGQMPMAAIPKLCKEEEKYSKQRILASCYLEKKKIINRDFEKFILAYVDRIEKEYASQTSEGAKIEL